MRTETRLDIREVTLTVPEQEKWHLGQQGTGTPKAFWFLVLVTFIPGSGQEQPVEGFRGTDIEVRPLAPFSLDSEADVAKQILDADTARPPGL